MTIKNNNLVKFSLLILFLSFMQGCATTTSVKKTPTITVHLDKPPAPAEVVDVHWAGFAFLGDYSQRETRYPYTSKIANQKVNGDSVIDKSLRSKLQGFSTSNYNLDTGLGDLESGEGLSMALGVSYEDVYVVPFDGDYKVSYEIGLNLVVFDFVDKKIITVYPLRFLRNEVFSHRPTEAENEKIIKSLYGDNGFNILQETINRMGGLVIRPSYGSYIGVRNVNISNQAFEKIPNNILANDIIKTQVAQELEGLLSKNTYTPVVPFSKGEIIGRSMAARFSNGKAYMLKLPELDYYIDVELRDFKKKSSEDHKGFASLITIKASTDLAEISNIKLSHNAWVINEMSGNSKDSQWTLYEESLSKLLNDFTKQLAISNSQWIKQHSVTKNAEKQMEGFRGLIRKSQ